MAASCIQSAPLRVLHLIGNMGRGGANMMLLKLVSRLQPAGFDNTILTLMPRSDLEEEAERCGVRTLALDMPRGALPTPGTLLKLRAVCRERRPQILQGWMYHGNLAALLGRRFVAPRPPVVWNIRQSLHNWENERALTKLLIRLGAWVSGRPDWILNNSWTAKAQHEARGYARERSSVIPNGFDLGRFSPDLARGREERGRLGIPADARVIGSIARLNPYKGHLEFIDAAARIAPQFPEALFLIAGPDGELPRSEVEARIAAHGLADRFRLLGGRADVENAYRLLDIFVSPSHAEAFSNAIGEAMACGVPCVVTDVGDSARLVGDAGKIVPPRDAAALAAALREFLECPRAALAERGAAARRTMEERYGLDRVAEEYAALYRRLARVGG